MFEGLLLPWQQIYHFAFFVQFVEQLLKFLANVTLLKSVKFQRSYGVLITKKLIFGFQILDLKVHFSASLTAHSCRQGITVSSNFKINFKTIASKEIYFSLHLVLMLRLIYVNTYWFVLVSSVRLLFNTYLIFSPLLDLLRSAKT